MKKILSNIKVPTLILNEKILRNNVSKMLNKAKNWQVSLNPPCKTHQSKYIANILKEMGIGKITVASVQMANYFAEPYDNSK